jgi:hypothetical protein
MTRFSTLAPAASVSYFTPSPATSLTNIWSGYSLTDERIRSAFESAQKELTRYDRYPPRWDGYRAEPFDKGLLREVASILTFSEASFLSAGITPNLLTTGPASDGSLDVEIQVRDRHVVMTLYPREPLIRVHSSHAKDTQEHLVALGTQALEDWLSWLPRSSAVPSSVDSHQSHS